MPTILTYFDDPGANDYPFDDPAYVHGYHKLARYAVDKGTDFIIVRSPEAYVGSMTFSRGWKYVDGTFREVTSPIRGDVIYVKGYQLKSDASDNVVNRPDFAAECGYSKQHTIDLFPDFSPTSEIVSSHDAMASALNRLRTDRVVIKPDRGFGGKSVAIGSRSDILASHPVFPVIVQEFVDTSSGIPGVTPSTHDFRIVVMDGRMFMTILRVPATGKLVANVSQGGTLSVVPANLRPPEIADLVKAIDAHLHRFTHRLYAIDCGRDVSGRWVLFELNDQPGLLTPEECGDDANAYYDGLADYLIQCAVD